MTVLDVLHFLTTFSETIACYWVVNFKNCIT